MAKTGLGKGLSALIPTTSNFLGKDEPVNEVEIEKVVPNTFQPRRTFDPEKMTELVESIRQHGVVQPVVVRKLKGDRFELVVGERRLRACQQLALNTVPAVIKELTDEQMMEIALVENIQRQDLNPVEEAHAYKRLLEDFKLTQEQVAQKVSKSRPFVANMVRLLNLPNEIIGLLSENKLTIGHARPLLALEKEEAQLRAAREVVKKNLSVRETENMIKLSLEEDAKKRKSQKKAIQSIPEISDLEAKLRGVCGTKVVIKDQEGKGKIEIDYYSQDDFERILAIFIQPGTH